MENRLLTQYENVITSQWLSQQITESYDGISHRELFEIAYHTNNTVGSRAILIKLSQDNNKGVSKAILYSSKAKLFTNIESLDDFLKITVYFGEGGNADKLFNDISPKLKSRKENFIKKEKNVKNQIMKTILVERKLDECANLVMIKDIARKVYFAIGDARESAAVIPMFQEAKGANLVQLALHKWMETTRNLQPEEKFPDSHMGGLLKNLLEIKKWILTLVSNWLDK
ncbi:MAG: putative selenocysteine system protein [Promethearchaeota archaeon]